MSKATQLPTLPDKVSEVLKVALADLKKAEQDPAYAIDMSVWHEPISVHESGARVPRWDKGAGKNVCLVCLAGSVIAGTLGAGPDEALDPSKFSERKGFPPGTQTRLEWLDLARAGAWRDIFESYGSRRSSDRDQIIPDDVCGLLPRMPKYSNSPEAFKKSLELAIIILEELQL